jgi:hypothetical protein
MVQVPVLAIMKANKGVEMARGSKAKYSPRQKRQAHHIEASVMKRGGSRKTAERIGWATVNKNTGGARKSKGKSNVRSSRSAHA